MPRRTIIARIPPDLWRLVGYRSADTGRPKGVLVAEALEAWLESPGEVSAGPVGPTLTTSVSIDEDLHSRLTAAADAAGVSVAEVVRAAIAAAMAARAAHAGGDGLDAGLEAPLVAKCSPRGRGWIDV